MSDVCPDCGADYPRKHLTTDRGEWIVCEKCSVGRFNAYAAPIVGTDDTKAEPCQCATCTPMGLPGSQTYRFITCAICGNKRCPHATDHRNACTNSNEPGQKGSSWEHYRPPGAPTDKPAPRCSDGMACTMPGDCQRKGYCISDATDKPAPEPEIEQYRKGLLPPIKPDANAGYGTYERDQIKHALPDASASVLTRAIGNAAHWQAEAERLARELAEARAELARARQDNETLARAILWALGYDMGKPKFAPPPDNKPRYWWRNELERRAGGHAALAAFLARDGGK